MDSYLKDERDQVEGLLSTVPSGLYDSVFAFGHPEGDDIDLCFITGKDDKKSLRDYLGEAETDLRRFHIHIASRDDFYKMMDEHGHKAVEFRAVRGADYLQEALKSKNLKIPVIDMSK
jgi:hypothetical protein